MGSAHHKRGDSALTVVAGPAQARVSHTGLPPERFQSFLCAAMPRKRTTASRCEETLGNHVDSDICVFDYGNEFSEP